MGHSDQSAELVRAAPAVYQLSAERTVRDVAAVLFRRKRIIVALFFAILAGATLGLTWLAPYWNPPRFASGLKFIIKKERFDAVVTPADRAVPGLTTTVAPQEVYAEIELLRSADVADRLAQQARLEPASVERLGQDLVIEPVVAGRSVTSLIAVRYSSLDRDEVRRVLDTLPDVYLQKHLSMNRRPAALDYFRSQAESFQQQLQDTEQQLEEFEKRQSSASTEVYRRQAAQKLADLEKQRLETEAGVREADSRALEWTRQLSALPATAPGKRAVEPSAYGVRLKTQLLELENRRAQSTFYRDIEQLNRRIEETRQAITGESQGPSEASDKQEPNPLRAAIETELLRNQVLLAGLRARRTSLLEQERVCRGQLASSRMMAAQDARRLAELTRNLRAAEENFLLYRKKYAEAREAEALDQKRVLNVSLAEGPRAPVRVYKRSRWFYLAIGFVVAAVCALGVGFAVETLDHSIHTPRQLESCSALPVLGCLPESKQG